MDAPRWQERGEYWKAEAEAIERRAFENHVLELVRALAPLGEAAYRDQRGVEPNLTIREAKLVGEYPKTRIEFRIYDRVRDLELRHQSLIWDDYFRDGDQMRSPRFIAGEIMRWALGG